MDGRRDVAIDEIQSVIGGDGGRLICEARLVEGPIEEVSRSIPGEHSTGAVGPMGSGGESNNQHLGIDWTKRGHRFAPVLPVLVRFPFRLRDARAMNSQPGAFVAGDDLRLKLGHGKFEIKEHGKDQRTDGLIRTQIDRQFRRTWRIGIVVRYKSEPL